MDTNWNHMASTSKLNPEAVEFTPSGPGAPRFLSLLPLSLREPLLSTVTGPEVLSGLPGDAQDAVANLVNSKKAQLGGPRQRKPVWIGIIQTLVSTNISRMDAQGTTQPSPTSDGPW